MASIISAATGPWSQAPTWVGGVVPGNGDIATIEDTHIVTVDVNTTIGTGGAAGTIAVTVVQSDSAKLVIGNNVTFTVKGDMALYGRATAVPSRVRLELGQGSEVKLDTTGGNRQIIFGAGGTTLAKLVVTGISGNRAKFTKTGANTAGFTQAGNYSLTLSGAYCNVIGYTQDPCISWPNGLAVADATDVVEMDHFDFDGCGTVSMNGAPLNDMPFTLTNSTIINSVGGTHSFIYSRGAAAGANATVSGNVIDGPLMLIVENGITCEDNLFLARVTSSGTTKAVSWQRNLHGIDQDVDLSDLVSQVSDFIDCVFWVRGSVLTGPHWFTWSGTADQEVKGCIYDLVANTDSGDTLLMPNTPASPFTLTCHYNLLLPTESGGTTGAGQPGPLFSNGSALANAAVICEHNTSFVGDGSGIFLGEAVSGDYAGQCTSCKSNLFWNRNASPAGYKINCQNDIPNWVSAANADYNAGFNMLTGSRLKNYNFSGTGSPGAHDVQGQDPMFVDQARNMTTWAHSIDGSVTTPAGAVTLFKTKNNDGVTGISTAAARTWIHAGFAPTNAAYHNTGHDGTDIGAVPFTGPSGKTIPVTLFANPI